MITEEDRAAARARVTDELARLPGRGTPELARLVRTITGPGTISCETLVMLLQQAYDEDVKTPTGTQLTPDEVFKALLACTSAFDHSWSWRCANHAPPLLQKNPVQSQEEFLQELRLILWDRIVMQRKEHWGIYFISCLNYARKSAFYACLRRYGYYPERRDPLTRLSTVLAPELGDNEEETWAENIDLSVCISKLPEKQRIVVVKHDIEGKTFAEIAAEQDDAGNAGKKVGADTMRKRHDEALEALQNCLVKGDKDA